MTAAPALEYVVRRDHTVEAVDGPWEEFASANGAPELSRDRVVGRPLDEFVQAGRSMDVYATLIRRVLDQGVPLRFAYRCDSPDRRRFMEMSMEPVDGGLVRFRSCTVREEERPAVLLLQREAPRSGGDLLTTCGWCGRFRDAGGGWVEPETLAATSDLMSRYRFPRLSHGICPACSARMEGALATAS